MYFVFLWEVVKRAFTSTPRMTDGLQILAASAIPAISNFAGVEFPADTTTHVFAYIGMAALAFFAIRLLWAPYAIWQEDRATIGGLKLELSKPERLVLEHLAKKKAKFRIKLASSLERLYDHGFRHGSFEKYEGHAFFNEACRLIYNSGLDPRLINALITLEKSSEFRFNNKLDGTWTTDLECLYGILDFLNDRITIESLLRQWPQDIELKKPL